MEDKSALMNAMYKVSDLAGRVGTLYGTVLSSELVTAVVKLRELVSATVVEKANREDYPA